MKILFTGSSSFTGMWFISELVSRGHEVTALFSKKKEQYEGVRKKRVEKLLEISRPVFSCVFGDDVFFDTIDSESNWDLLCHHAADVTNYKSPEFDYLAALASNTKNLPKVLENLKRKGCQKVLLTGSVFEQNEGAGSDNLRAVSPYGLSKGLTADVFQFHCQSAHFKLGKFVIPNPFGPFEEERFTTFLVKSWKQGKVPVVSAPNYVRDNIPVSLLSKAYGQFAENFCSDERLYQKINPSFYAGNQGDFTLRFAKEMEKRLHFPCRLELASQVDFPEPKERINTDPIDSKSLGWNEVVSWDELANYYETCLT